MLPRKLKDFRLYNDANSYQGICPELTRPKLSHKMEEWRASGMFAPIMIDMGLEAIEMEFTLGGSDAIVVRQMGLVQHDGALLRFIGAYQSDADGSVSTIEIVVRGRHQELDPGTQKVGEDTETKVKTVCSFYSESHDGQELIYIDVINGIYRVGGVDRNAEIRAALGG